MSDIVHQVIEFWKGCDALLGLPLAAAGLALMLAGWRLWQPAVVLAFAAIGAGLAVRFGPESFTPALRAALGGIALGAAGVRPMHYSVPILGGALGASVVGMLLGPLGLPEAALWIAAGLAGISLAALSHVYREHVVILVTAFEGAVLVLFALFVASGNPQSLLYSAGQLIQGSRVLLPFAVIVPTVVGLALQLADSTRQKSGGS